MLEHQISAHSRIVRVALVDDDYSVRNGVSRLIRSHGFACSTFASGEQFLRAVHPEPVDCLILDVHLPGIDGFETRDRLLALGSRIPVIFITAHPDVLHPAWLRRLKGSTCLSKPFEDTDLLQALQAVVQ